MLYNKTCMRKVGDKMPKDELITRINELAKKAKTVGLTASETVEQKKLRALYLKKFRTNFLTTLKSMKVIDPDGNDVTPQKLKNLQKKK